LTPRGQCWVSAVSNCANAELVLSPTALMHEVFQISSRIFEIEFENNFGCNSGVHLGSIHERNQTQQNLVLMSL
jgi:hypothetical protein